MAPPKRRKPTNPTARLESQASIAWAKQNAKFEAAEAKAKVTQKEKEAREREIAAGHAEAEAVTGTLQARLTELATLLASTLSEDPYLPFERLKEPVPKDRFQPPSSLAVPAPAPELGDFLPQPPSGPGALLPGRKRAHADAVAQRRAEYEQEAARHARAEQGRLEQLALARAAYERALAADRERVRRQHAAIDQMARDFAVGRGKRSPTTSARYWPSRATPATSRPASRSPTSPPLESSSSTLTCRCWTRSLSWPRASTCPARKSLGTRSSLSRTVTSDISWSSHR
jgi:hypothetical protein